MTMELATTQMNEAAVDLYDEMLAMIKILRGDFKEFDDGSVIMDLGVSVPGGYLAGEYLAQLCLGGLAEISLTTRQYKDLTLPAITVVTDKPVEATLGSQFAGWSVNKHGYRAMASGPGRVLARKPKKLFEKLAISEMHDETVIVLEASTLPPKLLMQYFAEKCSVDLDCLCVAVAPTESIAGSTQISARSVETALHKLFDLGMDVTTVQAAVGTAPIAPLIRDTNKMMGRTNDMLIYGSEVFLQVDYQNNSELEEFISKAVSSNSKSYGSLFVELVEKAGGDFYKIDPAIFSPAKITINNLATGKTWSEGSINEKLLLQSVQTC